VKTSFQPQEWIDAACYQTQCQADTSTLQIIVGVDEDVEPCIDDPTGILSPSGGCDFFIGYDIGAGPSTCETDLSTIFVDHPTISAGTLIKQFCAVTCDACDYTLEARTPIPQQVVDRGSSQ
jgi:hypothetical protein